MTILAVLPHNGNTIKVEVLDAYEVAGVKYAVVKALEGKPFVGGDKWPVRTEYMTVKAVELIKPEPQPKKNLLTMALEQAREQWPMHETVWIYRNGQKGVYLKAEEGHIDLCVTGYDRPLVVFFLDLAQAKWVPARNLEVRYKAWAKRAQEVSK